MSPRVEYIQDGIEELRGMLRAAEPGAPDWDGLDEKLARLTRACRAYAYAESPAQATHLHRNILDLVLVITHGYELSAALKERFVEITYEISLLTEE
jgi:hypothetical protein